MLSSPILSRSTVDARVPGVERIAVLRANGIGDFVLVLPALEALRAAYPHAEITYLGAAWHPQLLGARPGPWDRVVVVPPSPGVDTVSGPPAPAARLEAFFAAQQAERYDLAIQVHGGGANSNPFVSALGARLTAGLRDRGAPPLDRWLTYSYYQHEVLRFLETVTLVGAQPVELEPRLAVTVDDLAAADAVLLGALGELPSQDSPLVTVHPGATDARRRWPAESFAAVAQTLADDGARVAVIGRGEDDRAAARAMAAGLRTPAVDLVDALSLPAMTGVLYRSRLVVANDSGPRHLAAAVGTATCGVFWCGNVINAGPLTRGRHRIAVSFRTHCPECGADQSRGRCAHDPSFVAEVPVEEVLRAARELYAAAEDAEPPAAAVRPGAW